MYNEIDFERDCENAAIGQAIIEDTANWCGLPESASIAQIQKAIYKGTACGAFINFTEFGVVVGSIIEGSDITIEYEYKIGKDYTREHYQLWLSKTLQEVENEADYLWRETNENS